MCKGWSIYREPTEREARVITGFGVDPTAVSILVDDEGKHLVPRRGVDTVVTFLNGLVEGG